ncbi:uncharacterized protein [Panulirus ornatus]|uniref:uncharacterized protein n=1 Tax=Panulirus ornatus TaxID=150431 RepID=UPI003A8A4A1D
MRIPVSAYIIPSMKRRWIIFAYTQCVTKELRLNQRRFNTCTNEAHVYKQRSRPCGEDKAKRVSPASTTATTTLPPTPAMASHDHRVQLWRSSGPLPLLKSTSRKRLISIHGVSRSCIAAALAAFDRPCTIVWRGASPTTTVFGLTPRKTVCSSTSTLVIAFIVVISNAARDFPRSASATQHGPFPAFVSATHSLITDNTAPVVNTWFSITAHAARDRGGNTVSSIGFASSVRRGTASKAGKAHSKLDNKASNSSARVIRIGTTVIRAGDRANGMGLSPSKVHLELCYIISPTMGPGDNVSIPFRLHLIH